MLLISTQTGKLAKKHEVAVMCKKVLLANVEWVC